MFPKRITPSTNPPHPHPDALTVDGKSAFFVARQTLMSLAAKNNYFYIRSGPVLCELSDVNDAAV